MTMTPASTPRSLTPSSTTCSTPAPVIIPEDFPFATSADRRDVAAKSLQYQRLERALDMSAYTKQVELLLSQPIKIPANHSHSMNSKKTYFPVRGIWPTDEKRKEKISRFYSFGNVKGREWLRDLLLDESDSEEDCSLEITPRELREMLRQHKMQRDIREQARGEGVQNSPFAYYGAGLVSSADSYNDGTKIRNKPVEVNSTALNQLPSAPTSPSHVSQTVEDDMEESELTVDANFPNSTVIPLPPLSH